MPTRRFFLLLGCTLVVASAATPFQPLDIYGLDGPAFFSKHRVQEIQIMEQAYAQGVAQGPVLAVSVQRLDARGRLVYELSAPRQGRFFFRREYAYDPADHQSEVTSYGRLDDKADTTRRGRTWLPFEHTRWAPSPAGRGSVDTWNERTGDWQHAETSRCWTSHDTTYQLSVRVRPYQNTSLTRSYASPGGLHRYDLLTLSDGRLVNLKYFYSRQEQGRPVESGLLSFAEALNDLLSRQQLPPLESGTASYYRALDNLARHSAGRPVVQATRTYDAQGQLLALTDPSAHLTLQRTAQGQVGTTEQLPAAGTVAAVAEHTTYVYQPDGLVARQEVADSQGKLTSILHYKYRYF